MIRREFIIKGLASALVAAPAVVRFASIMPVRSMKVLDADKISFITPRGGTFTIELCEMTTDDLTLFMTGDTL